MKTGYMQCILRTTRQPGTATLTITSPTLRGTRHTLKTR